MSFTGGSSGESIRTEQLSFPPDIYKSQPIGSFETESGRYTVVLGLNFDLAGEYEGFAKGDRHKALRWDGDDGRADSEGYADWYQKTGRTPFALLDPAKQLVAVIWIGAQASVPDVEDAAAEAAQQDSISMETFGHLEDKDATTKFLARALEAYISANRGRSFRTVLGDDAGDIAAILQGMRFKAGEASGNKTPYTLG